MSPQSKRTFNVVKGPPSQSTSRQVGIRRYVTYFSIAGIILALSIKAFEDTIASLSAGLTGSQNYTYPQVIMGSVVTMIVSIIQVGVFRDRIKSRQLLFIILAGFGGAIGGFVVGSLIMSDLLLDGFAVGALLGGIAGLVSSSVQVKLMNQSRKISSWVTYNSLSWAVVYAIGWQIGWKENINAFAFGALFIMVGAGIALAMYLNYFQQDLEFS